jgi:hypothetical protein
VKHKLSDHYISIPFEPSVCAESYIHSEPVSETPSIQMKTHTMHTQSLSQKVLNLETTVSKVQWSIVKIKTVQLSPSLVSLTKGEKMAF